MSSAAHADRWSRCGSRGRCSVSSQCGRRLRSHSVRNAVATAVKITCKIAGQAPAVLITPGISKIGFPHAPQYQSPSAGQQAPLNP